MRLLNFLNESNEIIWSDIQKNCSTFLKDIGDNSVYRGIESEQDILKFTNRKKRKPLDISKNTQKYLDDIFKMTFGLPLRSEAVYCTSSFSDAEKYGNVFNIYPKGNYEVYWSPYIHDFYMNISNLIKLHIVNSKSIDWDIIDICILLYYKQFNNITLLLNAKAYPHDYYVKLLERFNLTDDSVYKEKIILENIKKDEDKKMKKWGSFFYKKGKIKDAIKSGNEILLICNEYYLISDYILKEFKNG